jgi:flagellar protein FlaG
MTMPNDQVTGVSQVGHPGQAVNVPQGAPEAAAASAGSPAVTPAEGVRAQPSKADAAAVKQAADSINEFIKSTARNLQFSVDKDTGTVVVKVVDQETGDVIRQIPAEETLAIAKNLDASQGVIIRSKA